jgi:hypothetical protein
MINTSSFESSLPASARPAPLSESLRHGGFHAIVIDVSDDCILHVSDNYPTVEDAELGGRKSNDVNN